MRKNPKAFWSKIRGPIEKAELTDCEGAVNYFSTLLNVEHSITDIQPTGEPSCSDLGEPLASLSARLNEPFTEAEVGAALGSLSNAKSTSDQLPSELFKYAKVQDPTTGTWNNVVVGFLLRILIRIFVMGIGMPEEWKKAFLVPIWKGKGNKKSFDSYRGISILSSYLSQDRRFSPYGVRQLAFSDWIWIWLDSGF
jgi:hypothetical protein